MNLQHFIFDTKTGKEIDLIQIGEVEGFYPGDRVRYSDDCYPGIKACNYSRF